MQEQVEPMLIIYNHFRHSYFDNVSDIDSVNGFTIALGQIDSSGNVTGATTTDPLTNPISYFYINKLLAMQQQVIYKEEVQLVLQDP